MIGQSPSSTCESAGILARAWWTELLVGLAGATQELLDILRSELPGPGVIG